MGIVQEYMNNVRSGYSRDTHPTRCSRSSKSLISSRSRIRYLQWASVWAFQESAETIIAVYCIAVSIKGTGGSWALPAALGLTALGNFVNLYSLKKNKGREE